MTILEQPTFLAHEMYVSSALDANFPIYVFYGVSTTTNLLLFTHKKTFLLHEMYVWSALHVKETVTSVIQKIFLNFP